MPASVQPEVLAIIAAHPSRLQLRGFDVPTVAACWSWCKCTVGLWESHVGPFPMWSARGAEPPALMETQLQLPACYTCMKPAVALYKKANGNEDETLLVCIAPQPAEPGRRPRRL